ncbi:AEC family transporter [Sphingomonas sp. BK580]|uniref:AEC family transporter n=1 Tax=Sphingomonas sp. BK580 TaxID=2586972 RepID=UPI001622B11F|nr:AEC family transporter [Sphingomonas sp. BK580]MBB3695209.1 hypothetical protein [Sphingomonas sp. BK580]
MSLPHTILASLAPIFFVTALGWLAGRRKWVPEDASATLAGFVIRFALPLSLFLAAASADRSAILNAPFVLTIAIGLMGSLGAGYLFGRLAYRRRIGEAAVQGVSTAFANMAYCGPPVMLAVVGPQGMLSIVIGNLVLSMLMLPTALFALSHDGRGENGGGVGATLLEAVAQPLVVLPAAGLALAVLAVPVPAIVTSSVDQIGKAAGGVALFTLGLILSKIKPEIDLEVAGNVLIKNVLQPAILLGAGLALGLQDGWLKQAFLLGVLPTATAVPTFALAHHAYEHDSAETVLWSTLAAILSISGGIAIARNL